jgi:hypothetical protein
MKVGCDETASIVDDLRVTSRAAIGLRVRRRGWQGVARTAGSGRVSRGRPDRVRVAMAVRVATRPGVVVRRTSPTAFRKATKRELSRSCRVGVARRVHTLRDLVALVAGNGGVRRRATKVNLVGPDAGIRDFGRAEEITRWGCPK